MHLSELLGNGAVGRAARLFQLLYLPVHAFEAVLERFDRGLYLHPLLVQLLSGTFLDGLERGSGQVEEGLAVIPQQVGGQGFEGLGEPFLIFLVAFFQHLESVGRDLQLAVEPLVFLPQGLFLCPGRGQAGLLFAELAAQSLDFGLGRGHGCGQAGAVFHEREQGRGRGRKHKGKNDLGNKGHGGSCGFMGPSDFDA